MNIKDSIFKVLSGVFGYLLRFWQEKRLQKRKFSFDAAIMSHMSRVVFDKYAEFSEEYLSNFLKLHRKLWETADILSADKKIEIEEGRSPLGSLSDLRHRYIIWIPEKVNTSLIDIENTIWKGISAALKVKNFPSGSERIKAIKEYHRILFEEILGVRSDSNEETKRSAYERAIDNLRKVLMIEKLFSFWGKFSKEE